ncbi:MAG: chemotaxis protein CheA [Sulfuricurvum sp.]|nr:chemotaxis protein CheA [Sulfuricurvum sp.]
MNEELQYFYEDAKDQLSFMEQGLMDIVEQGVNDEAIGAIFRAMHTIKGTAGMFDFNAIVSFTHIAENLLDSVRQKKVPLDENLLELLLQVKDHVEKLIESAIANTDLSQETITTDALLRNSLSESLTSKIVNNTDITVQNAPTNDEPDERVWHISLRLKEDFFKTGMDILSIFDFFSSVGDIISILPVIDNIPNINDIDPLHSYIGFEIFFLTAAPLLEIEEIFEFVAEDIDLIIISSDDQEQLQQLMLQRPEIIDILATASLYKQTLNKQNDEQDQSSSTPQPKDETFLPSVPSIAQNTSLLKESNNKITQSKATFLRVDFQKIDLLINQVSEMVIANAKITQMTEKYDDPDLDETTASLAEMLDTLRDAVMNIRMVQVEESFSKLRRNVSDVAKKVGKSIEFTINGGETELDKSVVEKLSDPLIHMLRNSIDHGIENAQERLAVGKPEQGQVWLRAHPESGSIVIEIEDDGRGLNTQVILNKAITKGLVSPNDTLTDDAIHMLIFHPGFSTAENISDISGRGVGMDVVKQNIDALKGRIDILNNFGYGCKFIITLPLTLAIIDGFLIQAGSTKYIIPQDMIQEVIEFKLHYLVEVGGSTLLNLRGELLPLLNIKHHFSDSDTIMHSRENIVVVRYGSYMAGLIVDELFGEQQTVVKSLGSLFHKVPGISGGSILGSGEIALIFDIPALIEYVIHHDNR